MFRKFDLEEPQKQAYLRYNGDGIADILVGAAFIGIGLMLYSDMPFVPVWIVILLAPVSWALKRWITLPRLSEAEADILKKEEGPYIQKIKMATIIGVLLLSLVVLLTALSPEWIPGIQGPYFWLGMIGFTLFSVLAVLGAIYHSWRWIAYALLVIPAMVLMVALDADFPQVLAALGTLIFLCGLVIAARFVSTHPRY